MEVKTTKKKGFHKRRCIRLDDDIYYWLLKIKRGTWNNTFYKLRQKYGDETMQGVPKK
jgi:hypothetical protein